MNISIYIDEYKRYLQLEKNLSINTLDAYIRDINKIIDFINLNQIKPNSVKIDSYFLNEFVKWIAKSGIAPASQARIISGIRSFFNYLILEKIIDENPAEMLELPKLVKKLPNVLSFEEIEKMISFIDLSITGGFRNKVMLELLFACGLRVSELINLKKSDISFDEEWIIVTGKGNKQRLVPISTNALNLIKIYLETERNNQATATKDKEILFLNRRGAKLSRVFIFNVIKELTQKAGINKNVSPHTLRHSFATGLVTNGADLRAVQNMLGHESITTTEIYTHLDRKFLKNTIDEFHPRSEKRKNKTPKED